ncbi:MAG: 5'-methylthioadenosine/S-adenosylhomocysteine nucleosidase, partial [Oscillospiraceae bacterium]|nr:5'-methylthioadenosine/S-adenosylhomocysteine nucleosidase [Oscillospiraceae bacterium]
MEDGSQIRIGIIGAMDEEVDSLRREANAETPVRIADMDFCEGIFDGRPVVIAKCGVGKVNAAICAQIMITRFQVSHIINTG